MRKQSLSHEDFLELKTYAQSLSYASIKKKVDVAKKRISKFCSGNKSAYAWSGGKDSLGLQICCEEAGVSDCVMAITDVEYPEFLQWVTVNMPDGLTVMNSGVNIEYLLKHPEMLFPQNATNAAKWFKAVQHKVQNKYFKEKKLDYIILGRRLEDGNYIGKDGRYWYTSKDVTRLSPIYDWTHIDIFTAIYHYKREKRRDSR
jgi:3'-phosphoadenosine 5'-phosphosulfate sulfotransferase (PAPS reductase)/FAD synthetase